MNTKNPAMAMIKPGIMNDKAQSVSTKAAGIIEPEIVKLIEVLFVYYNKLT